MSVNEGLGYRGPFIVMILFLLIVMAGIVLVNGKMAGGGKHLEHSLRSYGCSDAVLIEFQAAQDRGILSG